MDKKILEKAQWDFWQRNQTDFLSVGFQPLLTVYVPWIIQAHGTVSVLINGLKYVFSLTNAKVFNSGIHVSECFTHSLSNRLPLTADFQLDVVPLLADGKQPVKVLAKVRSVVFHCPVPSKIPMLETPALEDPEVLDQNIHPGIFVCGGRQRTIPCIKSMFNNTPLLTIVKGVYRLQVRSDHEGNRSMEDGNPFRSTSSIDFEVAKKLQKKAKREITCTLPFSKHKVHIAVLAQAFGCGPQQFVEFVRAAAGADYDAPTFRCYEIDIVYGVGEGPVRSKVTDQNSAILALSKLSDKDAASTGINLLKTEVFPHLNVMFDKGNKEELYFAKLFYLAMCTSMLILFAAGRIEGTPRDLWQYASMIMPAFQIGQLIRSKFIIHMKNIAKSLRRSLLWVFKKQNDAQVYPDLVKLFGEPRLSYQIMSAVSNGAFSKRKQGVSIQLNDNNEDAILSQLLQATSSLKTTDSVHTNPRKVQKDSYGYPCAASTPDGDKVGLDTIIACTATITVDLLDPRGLCELLEMFLKDYLLSMVATLLHQPHALTATSSLSASVALMSHVDVTRMLPEWYLFINNCGVPTHFVRPEHVDDIVRVVRLLRRNGEINRNTFIKVTHHPRQIRIMSEGGQIIRALIVLANLNRLTSHTMSFTDMLHQGIIEYMNPAEEQTLCKVALSFDDLRHAVSQNQHQSLTHMEFTPAALVGIMAATIPFLTSCQGPRIAYAEHTKKQVITAGVKRNHGSIQSTELWHNHKELVYTKIARSIPEAADGRGFNGVIAFIALDRDQEDAVILHKQAIDRGMFSAMTTRHYTSNIKAPTNILSERFEKANNVLSKKHLSYSAIQPNGYPLRGAKIPGGEVVLSKTRAVRKISSARTNNNNSAESSQKQGGSSKRAREDDEASNNNSNNNNRSRWISRRDIAQVTRRDEGGTVRDVQENTTIMGKQGRVSVVTERCAKRGDKVTSKHAQKGVCGAVWTTGNMPFSERTGLVPDVVVSPLGIVSRMTMASKLEGAIGKAVCVEGDTSLGEDPNEYDGNNKDYLVKAGEYLVKNGYKRNAAEYFRDGVTGKRYKTEVFVGVIYYHQLIHIAAKKLHGRACGPRDPLTRQSRQGKKLEGGLRWGELESAAAIAQGCAATLQARFRDLSDPFEIFVCSQCQSLADGNKQTNYAWCTSCQRRDTVYIVKTPFTFHLSSCELAAIGIKTYIDIKPSLNLLLQQPSQQPLQCPAPPPLCLKLNLPKKMMV